jgi:hypothetical protein
VRRLPDAVQRVRGVPPSGLGHWEA